MTQHNRNWDDLGRSIQDVVDRAVNSKDYQKLNQSIRQVAERAVDMGSEAVRKVLDSSWGAGFNGNQDVKKLYGSTVGESVKSLLKALGGAPLIAFGFLGLLGGAISDTPMTDYPAAAGFLLAVLATGVWLVYSGISNSAMVKRFRVYRRTLGQKTYCSVETLASRVGKNKSFVRRDLQRMIGKGFFREGHIDKEGASFITSDETYRYYEQSRLQLEQRQQEAAAKSQKTAASQDPQVQEVLDRGKAFLSQIRKCNDDIPGEEISEKISRIEMLVQRIFERAKAHPEIVPDLEKLMDYYLPMTVKLLNAYADMDAQPVQGETIQSSKREIEATLDTLNLAFEKLLDSVFMDTAMDVSSDISVLNTLLAQEGLTQDEFSKIKEQSSL